MTIISHSHPRARADGAAAGLFYSLGETLSILGAAVRIARAIEARQEPDSADLCLLGIKGPLPRLY